MRVSQQGRVRALLIGVLLTTATASLQAQDPRPATDSVNIRIIDTQLSSAVQMLGRYLDRPVVFAGNGSAIVTLETPQAVARADVVRLLRGLLESQGMELVDDSLSGLYRARPRLSPTAEPPPGLARDPRPAAAELELFVLPLKHARASDLAATIRALFGRAGGVDDVTGSRTATLGGDLRRNLVPTQGGEPAVTARTPGSLPAALSGEMTVVPDAKANNLLLRVNRADFELIRSLVEQIDVRPLQVLIEVLIAEVRRDRSVGIGVNGRLGQTAVRGTDMTMAGAIGAQGLGDFVLTVMGIGGTDADATLALSAQRGDVRILSRPVVLATNNQLAEINVGSQRPFVQVQRALLTDVSSRDQIVQYKDVGTKLTVTPSISADGSVHLEVTQEVSNATTETAFNAPVISTRSVQTQLLVRDGQTVVLGGLTDQQQDRNRRGIPLLSAIPWIGGFFGSSERRSTETELFVFLTPRVIRTDDDAMRLTAPLRAKTVDPVPL